MLTVLRIKNLALVTDLTLELQPGYNVITGETGAGKSILIGALNLVLGGRADRSLIRDGCDGCAVEAVFQVKGLTAPLAVFLEQNGLEPCDQDVLVLKRSITAAGSNRQFVNGSPAPLAVLAAIGEWLVDIHGPHEHQSLLHPARQLGILDAFAGLQAQRQAFGELHRNRAALQAAKGALIVDERIYARQLDLLRHQVNEINAAQLEPGEDERIEREYQRAGNAARLRQLSQAALDLLGESEASVLAQAGIVGRTLQELERADPASAPIAALHQQAVEAVRELQTALSRYADRIDVDPKQLQQLEERLNLIHSLKRKYGATLEDIRRSGNEARASLEQLEARDAELARINGELARLETELRQSGQLLSEQRRNAIPRLTRAVDRELAGLGFAQSRFSIALCTLHMEDIDGATQHGFDAVEFEFAPNPGEPARPLRAIASSGELARVMLALKTVLAAEDEIPVLVFDEVDANIGGETANGVGAKMRRIAARRQVLCITHLPQVAATATAHYVVTKQVKGGRTISDVRLLDARERVEEMTRMLGGQGEAARRHAEALLRGNASGDGVMV